MGIPAKRNIEFSILSKDKIDQIHEATIYLMENVGMRVGGDRGLELLAQAGCPADENQMVKIPRAMVEQALKSVPKTLNLYNRDGDLTMSIDRSNPVFFGTHADQLEYVDPDTGAVRDFLKKDTKTMCTLADGLDNIDFILSVGMSKDVNPAIQTQISFIETVTNFSKTSIHFPCLFL